MLTKTYDFQEGCPLVLNPLARVHGRCCEAGCTLQPSCETAAAFLAPVALHVQGETRARMVLVLQQAG